MSGTLSQQVTQLKARVAELEQTCADAMATIKRLREDKERAEELTVRHTKKFVDLKEQHAAELATRRETIDLLHSVIVMHAADLYRLRSQKP